MVGSIELLGCLALGSVVYACLTDGFTIRVAGFKDIRASNHKSSFATVMVIIRDNLVSGV